MLREIGTQANLAIKPAGDLTNPFNGYLHVKGLLPTPGANATNWRGTCEVFGHCQAAVIALHQRFVRCIHPQPLLAVQRAHQSILPAWS